MQYNYDSSGAIFSYFVVTIFTLTLVPYTFVQLFSRESTQALKCKCPKCVQKQFLIKKRKKGSNKYCWLIRWFYLVFGWLLFSGVLYTAFTVFDEEPELWDPYRILGVENLADGPTVKKAYKKLTMK
jgi:translocation protein SEC63